MCQGLIHEVVTGLVDLVGSAFELEWVPLELVDPLLPGTLEIFEDHLMLVSELFLVIF